MRFTIDKRIGETPLEALERVRRQKHIDASVPMTYAGRLDPMVSGALLILTGEDCKRQEEYRGLDKEYVVEVLFGLRSDTGDILGIVEIGDLLFPSSADAKNAIASFVGPYNAPYPLYSSKPVDGKPLFQHALEGSDIERPLQHGTIHAIAYKGMRTITASSLQSYVKERIGKLTPVTAEEKALGRDFRKDDALASWKRIPQQKYAVLKIKVRTSSGVYMRTLAEDIGKKLSAKALALSIRRTRIFT